jgi:hypothetical protein
MDNDESVTYRITAHDGRYRLVNAEGNTLLECQDEASARHYAELMNKAWRSGFRAGYREGKQAGSGKSLQ